MLKTKCAGEECNGKVRYTVKIYPITWFIQWNSPNLLATCMLSASWLHNINCFISISSLSQLHLYPLHSSFHASLDLHSIPSSSFPFLSPISPLISRRLILSSPLTTYICQSFTSVHQPQLLPSVQSLCPSLHPFSLWPFSRFHRLPDSCIPLIYRIDSSILSCS